MAINVYQYIAESNPHEAENLIAKYGYSIENVQSTNDLAECLSQLIANEGEEPLYDLAEMHPDSHLIIEAYQHRTAPQGNAPANEGCNCSSCKGKSATSSYIEAAQNASNSFLTINQSGLLLIGGLLIITLALIATKN